jgi:hypothetical protein
MNIELTEQEKKDLNEYKKHFSTVSGTSISATWLAACQYKQEEFEKGHQGACYACENVGETNQRLEKENKKLQDRIKQYECIVNNQKNVIKQAIGNR